MKRLIAAAVVIATAAVLGAVTVAATVGAATASTSSTSNACGEAPAGPDGPGSTAGGTGAVLAASAARSAGFTGPDLFMAVAIAGAESSYRPTVRNSIGASGLWQILQSAHPDLFTTYDWRDPAQNALMAHSVWTTAGRSWTPWTTYTSGAYRAHLAEARAAVAATTPTATTPRANSTGAGSEPAASSASAGASSPENASGSGASSPPSCSPTAGGLPPAPRPFTGPDGYVDDPTTRGRITRRTLHTYTEINRAFGDWPWGVACWDPHAWNPASDHLKGKACDFTVGRIGSNPDAAQRAKGWELAHWVQTHAAALDIAYVIWDGRIWSPARADEGWRRYTGGGVYDVDTPTGRHADHLHLSEH